MRTMRLSRGLQIAAVALAMSAFSVGQAMAKYASYVVDADTGRVLNSVNADELNYPASLTKMMTLYLLFEALDKGKVKLSTPLQASAHAERQPATRLGLQRGEKITVHQAILGLVTLSANDAAVVVGEALGGSEEAFAQKMTDKARKLGMSQTTFRNASGLPNRGQMTTARDMAVLAKALMENYPQYYHFFSTHNFTYGGRIHKNHNQLLESYDGTDGLKTGYIAASGFNLVASAKRDGHRLIGVVLGGKTAAARNSHMVALLDRSFATVAAGNGPRNVQVASVGRQAPAIEESQGDTDAGTTVAAATPGGWGIQVGSFTRHNPAYEAAVKAVAKAPRQLEDGSVDVESTKVKKKTVYRARVVGIERDQAAQACRILKKKGTDCVTIRVRAGA